MNAISNPIQVVRGDQELRNGDSSSSSLAHNLGKNQVTRQVATNHVDKAEDLNLELGKAVGKFCSGLGKEIHVLTFIDLIDSLCVRPQECGLGKKLQKNTEMNSAQESNL